MILDFVHGLLHLVCTELGGRNIFHVEILAYRGTSFSWQPPDSLDSDVVDSFNPLVKGLQFQDVISVEVLKVQSQYLHRSVRVDGRHGPKKGLARVYLGNFSNAELIK